MKSMGLRCEQHGSDEMFYFLEGMDDRADCGHSKCETQERCPDQSVLKLKFIMYSISVDKLHASINGVILQQIIACNCLI